MDATAITTSLHTDVRLVSSHRLSEARLVYIHCCRNLACMNSVKPGCEFASINAFIYFSQLHESLPADCKRGRTTTALGMLNNGSLMSLKSGATSNPTRSRLCLLKGMQAQRAACTVTAACQPDAAANLHCSRVLVMQRFGAWMPQASASTL